MNKFSEVSLSRLNECHPALIRLFTEVIKHYDCSVLCGHRGEAEQEEAVRTGKSKVHYPKSKHNSTPSMAVDVVPYPLNWKDDKAFNHFAGFVMGVASIMNIKIRWGGDFNSDRNFYNDTFMDMPHFELAD